MKNKIVKTLFLCFIFFSTYAQKSSNDTAFFFVQITDPQFGFIAENRNFATESELYTSAVNKINKLNPSFIVITGDFVNDKKNIKQIEEFKRITKLFNKNIPIHFSPGNHDIGQEPNKEDLSFYFLNYGKNSDRFSFNYQNSTFIGFNSVIIKSRRNKSEEKKQFRWIKKNLRKARRSNNIILFTHYPFFIANFSEETNYSNQSVEMRIKYFNLFKKYRVTAIFSGHLHNNAYSNYGRIHNIITSSLGKQLGNYHPGIRIVKVYKNRIEHSYYSIDEIPDKIEIDDNITSKRM